MLGVLYVKLKHRVSNSNRPAMAKHTGPIYQSTLAAQKSMQLKIKHGQTLRSFHSLHPLRAKLHSFRINVLTSLTSNTSFASPSFLCKPYLGLGWTAPAHDLRLANVSSALLAVRENAPRYVAANGAAAATNSCSSSSSV